MKKTALVFSIVGMLCGLVGIVFWLQWIHMLVGSYTAFLSIIGIYFSDIPHGTWRLYLILIVLLGGITVSLYLIRYSLWNKLLATLNVLLCISGIAGILLWQYLGNNPTIISMAVIGGELFIRTFFWSCLLSFILGLVCISKLRRKQSAI